MSRIPPYPPSLTYSRYLENSGLAVTFLDFFRPSKRLKSGSDDTLFFDDGELKTCLPAGTVFVLTSFG
nr:hypothetical protein Itr_chr11CG02730 [Ipomoea trifida]